MAKIVETFSFEHITLKRGSGFLVDAYIYTRKVVRKGRVMVRCQERKCPAKGYILDDQAHITNDSHNHPPPDVRAIRFRAQLKEAIAEDRNKNLSVPDVYEQVKWNFMQQAETEQQREELEATLPTRTSVERALHRRRSEILPQVSTPRQAPKKVKPQMDYFGNMIPASHLKEAVQSWLREDIPNFDFGGFVVGDKTEKAVLLCKSKGVLAGVPFFNAVFSEVGCTVQWHHEEGTTLDPVCKVATVKGKVCNILRGERTALNCITRASGIASLAKRLSSMAKQYSWHGQIAGTRKTTPGFRMVEKYALIVGGVSTHRYDLSSMIMLKDNHIWSSGSIREAVGNAKKVGGFSTKVEVECRSLQEATEAASAGADVIMLDNFQAEAAHRVADELKCLFPHLLIEVSGGITETMLPSFFGPCIDVISMSRLTQGYGVVDFSLKIQKEGVDPSNPTITVNPNDPSSE
ncbi:Nicotinate-nucleotide pyrophosphorylase [carboxylating] [Holothuria leucospilota]|uniref:Nicotinate-nucleotide pyrophosphorylase [carboxylating] n=1 Tax=Holothuria leucospilota TaxID=206669 RepID=A0A9Q1CD73_HOLLE|nr:Nicotinate-nucleotide pyrophosphorylase [carboxylating] [Holothuria leucospilota]